METESNTRKQCKSDKGDQCDDKEQEILKARISKHPLYGMLLQQHLECLKVGVVSANLDRKVRPAEVEQHNTNGETLDQTAELDLFMEAYCFALSKLKEALREPQTECLAFVNDMHSQLMELERPNHPTASASESFSSSSFSDTETGAV